MRFFGVNYGPHDGGVACFDNDGGLLLYSQTERLTRKKADRTAGFLADLLRSANLAPVQPTDLFFTTWPNYYRRFFASQNWPENFPRRLTSPIPGFHPPQQVHFLNHHLCHVAASWLFQEYETEKTCLYIALDGSGLRADGSEGFYSVGLISANAFIEHGYVLDKFKYSPYCRLNRIALPHTDHLQVAGKLMGMSGFIPKSKLCYFSHTHPIKQLNARIRGKPLSESLMAECASIYFSFIHDVKEHLKIVLSRYPHTDVVVGGGAFLALEINSWLVAQDRRIIFAPCINDSGIALGSAAYGYFLEKGKWPLMLQTPYLQWHPEELQKNYLAPRLAAKYLANGEILGLLIGNGECGPRALGNRSLLAVPTKENAHKISVQIKGREFYRPVAPIVTDREFGNLFFGPPGRYMQFRNICNANALKMTPGIVHNDLTARAQVLRHQEHPWLYEMLVEVGKLTGVECLINTSLNGRGRPICNTFTDVRQEFAGTGVRIVNF